MACRRIGRSVCSGGGHRLAGAPKHKKPRHECRSDSMQTVQFDPYHVWLGIPAQEQPAHHYRLLGIALFEGQADVIATAADRQMGHLRTFQSGKHSPLSQRLLNEVATAKICLLNPAKKTAYDEQLRRRLQPSPPRMLHQSGRTSLPIYPPPPGLTVSPKSGRRISGQ